VYLRELIPLVVSSCAENSAMVVECRDRGGGHGCRCDRDSGEGHGRTDKGPCQCIHYGRNNQHQISARQVR